jgi:uncharacterized UBP type Zn finger protein
VCCRFIDLKKSKIQKTKLSEQKKPNDQQRDRMSSSSERTNIKSQQTVDISQLTQLINMGFNEDAAFDALTLTGDLEQAVNILLENPTFSQSSMSALELSLVTELDANEPNKQSTQQKTTKIQDLFEDPSKVCEDESNISTPCKEKSCLSLIYLFL